MCCFKINIYIDISLGLTPATSAMIPGGIEFCFEVEVCSCENHNNWKIIKKKPSSPYENNQFDYSKHNLFGLFALRKEQNQPT